MHTKNRTGRLARISVVTAMALAAVTVPVAAASAAPAAPSSDSQVSVMNTMRKAVISGPFVIRDDEGWGAGKYCRSDVYAEAWTDGVAGPMEWWRTYCGGEIRVELHAYARIVDTAGTLEFGVDAFFFEGTNDTNTDLDDQITGLRILVPADKTATRSIQLKNQENGGKDYATLDLTFSNEL